MLESFVRRNVGEIDAMIARAEQRLSLHERTENDSDGAPMWPSRCVLG